MIPNDLKNKLKKLTRYATKPIKNLKATDLANALKEICKLLDKNQYNKQPSRDQFIKSIDDTFKTTVLKKYYKVGDNDINTWKNSGLSGIILQDLYLYLTQKPDESKHLSIQKPGWMKCAYNKNALETSFKDIYSDEHNGEQQWITSVLYNEKVLKQLICICDNIDNIFKIPKSNTSTLNIANQAKHNTPTHLGSTNEQKMFSENQKIDLKDSDRSEQKIKKEPELCNNIDNISKIPKPNTNTLNIANQAKHNTPAHLGSTNENTNEQKTFSENQEIDLKDLNRFEQKIKKEPEFRRELLNKFGLEKLLSAGIGKFFADRHSIKTIPANLESAKKLDAQKSAIYLILSGEYLPVRFLGQGSYGTVWECYVKKQTDMKLKAVKVFRDNNTFTTQTEEVQNLYNLFHSNKEKNINQQTTKKPKKYLNLPKRPKNNDLSVLESPLAEGGLDDINCGAHYDDIAKENKTKENKTIDRILKKAKQALTAIKLLHDKGYSHNDIKESNFLKISTANLNIDKPKPENDYTTELNKINEELNADTKLKKFNEFIIKFKRTIERRKILDEINTVQNSNDNYETKAKALYQLLYRIRPSKNRLQLADLDTITQIPESEEGEFSRTYTPGYVSQSDMALFYSSGKAPKDALKKRDVYALGVTFVFLLIGKYTGRDIYNSTIYDSTLENIQNFPTDINAIKNEAGYKQLKQYYNGETDERFCKFLKLIKKMTEDEYTKRCTVEEALDTLQSI